MATPGTAGVEPGRVLDATMGPLVVLLALTEQFAVLVAAAASYAVARLLVSWSPPGAG